MEDIPPIGYGVGTAWFRSTGDEAVQALKAGVAAALDAGFRHIDEAEMYCNEQHTGEALRDWMARSGVDRAELWLTGKVLSVDGAGGKARRL